MKKGLRSITKSVLLVIGLLISQLSIAQITLSTQTGSTGYTGANGLSANTGITFLIENASATPYFLTNVSSHFLVASNGASVKLWYSSTSLSGATPSVNTTDWTLITTNNSISVTADGIVPVISGINFLIPANTKYRFCIESSNNIRYSGSAAGSCTPSVFTQNGVSLHSGESQINALNIGYSVTFTAGNGVLGNTPRWFTGTVTLSPATPCTTPPTAGTAVTASKLVCPSSNFDVNLTGSSVGSGLSYQWQESLDSISWGNVSGATNQKLTTNITTTKYFQCVVTCNSISSTSTAIKVSARPTLAGGTYTLNASLPNSSTNFNSFAEFNAALNCGISGPIVLNVKKGTYVGTLSLVNLSGTSAVNTITINGGDAKLIDTLISGKPDYILQIRGTNYVTIDSMTFEAHSSSTKGFVVSMGNANYNTIKNSEIIGDQTNSTSTFGALVISGSTSSATTATIATYNTFENNKISGGYYGLMMYGSTTIATQFAIFTIMVFMQHTQIAYRYWAMMYIV